MSVKAATRPGRLGSVAPDEVWKTYCATRCPESRRVLIERYLHLIEKTVSRVARNYPVRVDRGDLYSEGALGLIKAVDNFDPNLRVKFETYAITLIRIAVLEAARALDWVPRDVRESAKALENATALIEAEQGRDATEEEIASGLGIRTDALGKLRIRLNRAHIERLDQPLLGTMSGAMSGASTIRLCDTIADSRLGPEVLCQRREQSQQLKRALLRLTARERRLVTLRYIQESTWIRAGAFTGLSPTGAALASGKALLRLRRILADEDAGIALDIPKARILTR